MQSETTKKDITAVLAEVASEVVGQFEMKELLKRIIKKTMEILDAEVCSIFLRKENDYSILECVAGSGFAASIVGKAEYKIGEGFTGTVALGKKDSWNIKSREQLQALAEEEQWKGKFDTIQCAKYGGKSQYRNGIALPLKIKDQIFGVIKVENKIKKKGGYLKCVAGKGFAVNIVDKAEYKIAEKKEDITAYVAATGNEVNIRNPHDFDKYRMEGIWKGKYDHIQWSG